ncbi:MAG: serine O-acetyltransferase EpsC [Candidatus Margulisiibacteriota bacterium]
MEKIINELIAEIDSQAQKLNINKVPLISLEEIENLLNLFKKALFPGVFHLIEQKELRIFLETTLIECQEKLKIAILKFGHSEIESKKITNNFMNELPKLKKELSLDIQAIFDGDPAAKGQEEVIIAYPSLEAIMVYRIANRLNQYNCELLARTCSGIAHRNTGVDIHPGAKIGNNFCIDHGTGIVIGETAIIGQNVKMYQGVTIGALSVSKKKQNTKRHPTIEDNVTIYAGATILGGETIIGKNSIIGGNVWVTRSIPENSKIYIKENQ